MTEDNDLFDTTGTAVGIFASYGALDPVTDPNEVMAKNSTHCSSINEEVQSGRLSMPVAATSSKVAFQPPIFTAPSEVPRVNDAYVGGRIM